MLSAIGAPSYQGYSGSALSTASLEAQLAKYQAQLADWVHCPSCNTPTGKAKIKELSDKVSEIKQNIKSVEEAKQRGSSGVTTTISTDKNKNIVTSTSTVDKNAGATIPSTSGQVTGSNGRILDVFA